MTRFKNRNVLAFLFGSIVFGLILFETSFFPHDAVIKMNKYDEMKKPTELSMEYQHSQLKSAPEQVISKQNLKPPEKLPVNSSKIYSNCEVIHIGFVCSGYKASLFLYMLLKSLLFFRNNPLHIHIIGTKSSNYILETLFVSWDLPQVNFSFYDLNDYIEDIRWVPNTHYSGIHGPLKLLFPKIVSNNINQLIVLDTDLTFMGDIYELWNFFKQFNNTQVMGLTENESNFYLSKELKIWPAIGRGFNGGVILFQLDRLRNISWDEIWPRITKETAKIHGGTLLGEQDIINAVLKEYPHLIYEVPCYWNTQLSGLTRSDICYRDNHIKIIHWNSLSKTKIYNKDGDYFRTIYKSFEEMNGNLVKRTLYDCTKNKKKLKTSADTCDEFRSFKNNKWRTFLYFRNFNYIPVKNDVTFAAELSYDRLEMIEKLAKHWEGPISLTFYLSDLEFKEANNYIENSKILKKRTNIAYHVVFKEGDYHPINMLRNVGLQNVNTSYVFLADIELLPMFGLYNNLKNSIASIGNMEKKALIIPAFETQRYQRNFLKNKTELLEMWDNKSISTFRNDVWTFGHTPIDYNKWKTAKQPYTVTWEPDFEPYIVVKKDVIEYDNRFMDFAWNKISHIMELECQNYEFIVLHDAFVIYSLQSSSYDITKFRISSKHRKCLKLLKDDFLAELSQKYRCVFDNKKSSDEPLVTD